MVKLISVAFALAVATTSANALPVPSHLDQPEGLVTLARAACGAGLHRVGGACVRNVTTRHVRRAARRCAVWSGSVCRRYQ
jgi:hypothetical protein